MAIFAGLTASLTRAERRRTALRASLYAAVILVVAVVAGQIILDAIGIRADHDLREFLDRGQPPLGLDVELELLIVRDRPCADAANRRLDVLSLDGLDNVARRQVQPGQPVGAYPSADGIVLRPEQDGIANADGFGDMQQSNLEQANVEVVSEISDLIAAQRAYEMNAKVVSAADQMLQSASALFR